jgi:hypothetical protein
VQLREAVVAEHDADGVRVEVVPGQAEPAQPTQRRRRTSVLCLTWCVP